MAAPLELTLGGGPQSSYASANMTNEMKSSLSWAIATLGLALRFWADFSHLPRVRTVGLLLAILGFTSALVSMFLAKFIGDYRPQQKPHS